MARLFGLSTATAAPQSASASRPGVARAWHATHCTRSQAMGHFQLAHGDCHPRHCTTVQVYTSLIGNLPCKLPSCRLLPVPYLSFISTNFYSSIPLIDILVACTSRQRIAESGIFRVCVSPLLGKNFGVSTMMRVFEKLCLSNFDAITARPLRIEHLQCWRKGQEVQVLGSKANIHQLYFISKNTAILPCYCICFAMSSNLKR